MSQSPTRRACADLRPTRAEPRAAHRVAPQAAA